MPVKGLSVRGRLNKFVDPAPRRASLVGPKEFFLLNQSGNIDQIGWCGPQRDKLWRYNQHYFDDLNAVDNKRRAIWHQQLIESWIEGNPPYTGEGWEPYPTSLRIVNWVKYFLRNSTPSTKQLDSLATQANWLTSRLEYHLLGNHLLSNAKALYFAGCYLSGEPTHNWLTIARRVLNHQLILQILDDGGHFELSPMYHALVLEDILDLVNIATAYGHVSDVTTWQALIPKMMTWLKAMSHPDEKISFFNDAAFGVAPDSIELFRYAQRAQIKYKADELTSLHLISSGYVRAETKNAVLFCDVAAVGPDYLPGHAHADTLTFELSVRRQRVFVNSGCSEYGVSAERLRQRGTAAHNTVLIDGQNSSEVWSGFRVARRAHPNILKVDLKEGDCHIECNHSGYRRLPGRPTHYRRWHMSANTLEITDTITGKYEAATAFLHLHPEIKVVKSDAKRIILRLSSGHKISLHVAGGDFLLTDSTWHPEFGRTLKTQRIEIVFKSKSCCTIIEF